MLKDVKVHFNENYNAIIGGTGSGKSSLIDVFRYIFNNFVFNDKFKDITISRLKDIHKTGTKFTIYIKHNEKIYKIERELPSFDIFENYPKNLNDFMENLPKIKTYVLIADNFQSQKISTNELFEPIIYGQNELLDYSFDPKNLVEIFNSKLKDKIYDEFLSLHKDLTNRIDIFKQLSDNIEENEDNETQIEEISEEISLTQKKLEEINEKFPKLAVYNKEKSEFKLTLKFIEDDYKSISIFKEEIKKNIKTNLDNYDENISEIKEIYDSKLNYIYLQYEDEFKKHCKNENIQAEIEIQQYISKKLEEKEELQIKIEENKKKIDELEDIKTKYLEDLEKLKNLNKKLFEEWEKAAQKFTSDMGGATKITIDKTLSKEYYWSIIKKFKLEHKQIEKIVNAITPNDIIINFIKNEEQLKSLFANLKFKQNTINKIIGNITETVIQKLNLCLEWPSVKFYLKKNGNFFPIDKLSIGERCATLLNFVFCQSKEPVIIDQPEDNIDYNYIKNTISLLKKQKRERQFIIVSHNQNLPVLADSDLIMKMKNINDEKIVIECSGCLENEEIYNSILNLEGGKEAFEMRKKKYYLIEI